jgi:hypothetical protein
LAQVFGYGPPTADNPSTQSQLVSTDEKPAQTLEQNDREAARDAENEGSADGAVSEKTKARLLTATDLIAIQQLNARYGVALDGLVADAAARWADTFAHDGVFSIVDANGTIVLPPVRGTAALAELWGQFTDIATTRHWYNNLLIEPDAEGAKMMSYVIAISIQQFPATIERSGIYKDRLVKIGRSWKFESRLLILDTGSPVGAP